MSTTGLDRRTALRQLALGGAGAFVLPAWVDALTDRAAEHAHAFHAQAARVTALWKPKVLSAHQNATVVELTELIIPQTDTPGARAWLESRPSIRFRVLPSPSPFASAWIDAAGPEPLRFESPAEALRRLHARLASPP